jgi:carbon storage regulator CsrA
MLVLTRKSEQKIIIGGRKKVTITVLKVQGGTVSLGIEADSDTPIYREELLLEIEQSNKGGVVGSEDARDVKGLAKKLKLQLPGNMTNKDI